MLTTNFLQIRTSTRDFKDKDLEEEKIKSIYQYFAEIKAELGEDDLDFQINKNGKEVYEKLNGKAGYKGIMIKAPIYVGLDIKNKNDLALVKGAYGLEELITKLSKIDLASCWISVKDAKLEDLNQAFMNTSGNIKSILAIGESSKDEVKEHRYDDRKGVNEFVFIDDLDHKASVEELSQRGLDDLFSYLRFAPSSYNSQPWRFVLIDNFVKLYIEDYKDESNLIDAGIVMYYFDQLTKNLSKAKWNISPKLDSSQYVYIAEKEL